MMKILLFATALFSPLASANAAEAPPEQACDTMAQHPADPDRITAGKDRAEIDLDRAAEACRAALAIYPDEARFHYQLGRALYYRGRDEDIEPALRALAAASDRDYRQATFVLGFVYSLGDKVPRDICRAGHLWKRSLNQGHPWTRYYVSYHGLKGDFSGCSFDLSRAELDRHARSFLALGLDVKGDRSAALTSLLASE